MDPIELVNKADPDETVAWACGECGAVMNHRDLAVAHCALRLCKCGAECDRGCTVCRACIAKCAQGKLEAQVEAAEKIPANEYEGPVYWDQKDEYYLDAETAFEAVSDDVVCDQEGRDAAVLWACSKVHLLLDHVTIIKNALEAGEHYEGAYESVPKDAYEMLKVFLEEWNRQWGQKVESWFPDTKRQIIIPQEWWDEYDKDLCDD